MQYRTGVGILASPDFPSADFDFQRLENRGQV